MSLSTIYTVANLQNDATSSKSLKDALTACIGMECKDALPDVSISAAKSTSRKAA